MRLLHTLLMVVVATTAALAAFVPGEILVHPIAG